VLVGTKHHKLSSDAFLNVQDGPDNLGMCWKRFYVNHLEIPLSIGREPFPTYLLIPFPMATCYRCSIQRPKI